MFRNILALYMHSRNEAFDLKNLRPKTVNKSTNSVLLIEFKEVGCVN